MSLVVTANCKALSANGTFVCFLCRMSSNMRVEVPLVFKFSFAKHAQKSERILGVLCLKVLCGHSLVQKGFIAG